MKCYFTKKQALIIVGLLTCQLSNAGGMGTEQSDRDLWKKFYIGIDGGYSVSSSSTNLRPDMTNAQNYQLFFITPLNTDFHGDIGSAGMLGGFIGYHVTDTLGVSLNYDYRDQYNWEVLSRKGTELGSTETYKADISIQTLLVNLVLNANGSWNGFTPYVNAGIGAAFNRLGNFNNASVSSPGSSHIPTNVFNYTSADNSTTSFAWDAGVGIDYALTNKTHLTLGYRFVDAGKLSSSSNFTETVSGRSSTITPFITNHVLLNEFVAGLRWELG